MEKERSSKNIEDTLKFIKEVFEKKTTLCCLSIAVFILLIDYITGKNIQFPILYMIPIGIAAWLSKKVLAYLLAVFLPITRVYFYFLWVEPQFLHYEIVNATIRVLVLCFYVYLINVVVLQKKDLEKELKVLEGILHICSSCKRIRNENGEYEPIDKYITEHSETLFSHGICEDCGKKLYPEYFKKKEKQVD